MSNKSNVQASPVEMILDKFFALLLESDDVPNEIVDELKKLYDQGKLSSASHLSEALRKGLGEQA